MGLDISAQAIDEKLVRERLVPFVLGQGEIDDLIDRAAALSGVAFRANAWGLGALKLSWTVSEAQSAAAPRRMHAVPAADPPRSFLGRLFGGRRRTQYQEVELPDPVPGLPGFDSELCVWGRPFFTVSGLTEEALTDYERYMALVGKGDGAVDTLAQEMIARLEAARDHFPAGTDPAVIAATRAIGPFGALVTRDEEGHFDLATARAAMAKQAGLWRTLFSAAGSGRRFNSDTFEEVHGDRGGDDDVYVSTVDELLPSVPLSIVRFHAALHPGWMGRGYNYATFLFDKIGVECGDLFESPEVLFEPLIKICPDIRDAMGATINGNFSLGGYVPPQKVEALVGRLEANADELSNAWGERTGDDPMSAEFRKMLEPARYALRSGFGYLEAAEVYSGPLGWMN